MNGDQNSEHALWFRPLAAGPEPRSTVLCFPHAGGSASFYRTLAKAFPEWLRGLGVQYPGRQDRRAERPLDSVGELADRIYALVTGGFDAPPVLYGHSMGAVIAYEVARRLERDYRTVPALIVSGRRAPSVDRPEGVHLRGDEALLAELGKLDGTLSRLFADEEVRQMILPAVRADYRAIETYREPPGPALRCPVTAITGESDPRVTVAEAEAWRRHTTGGFTLRTFPGGHFFFNDAGPETATAIAGAVASAKVRTP